MTIEVGSVMEGTVTGITKFGAFVELPDKKVGLVHISEVANEYVKDVNDFLKVRDKVNVKVLSVEIRERSPCLSNRPSRRRKRRNFARNAIFARNMNFASIMLDSRRSSGSLSFEDRLSKFLKESDERLMDLKRNTESKRGGRGARHAD